MLKPKEALFDDFSWCYFIYHWVNTNIAGQEFVNFYEFRVNNDKMALFQILESLFTSLIFFSMHERFPLQSMHITPLISIIYQTDVWSYYIIIYPFGLCLSVDALMCQSLPEIRYVVCVVDRGPPSYSIHACHGDISTGGFFLVEGKTTPCTDVSVGDRRCIASCGEDGTINILDIHRSDPVKMLGNICCYFDSTRW